MLWVVHEWVGGWVGRTKRVEEEEAEGEETTQNLEIGRSLGEASVPFEAEVGGWVGDLFVWEGGWVGGWVIG